MLSASVKQRATTIKMPPPRALPLILFYKGFLDKIPFKTGLAWLTMEVGRVEGLAGEIVPENGLLSFKTITLQKSQKH